MAKKRKDEEKKIEKVGSVDRDILNKFFIALAILCIFCLFYLLTIYITNKNSAEPSNSSNNEKTETNISYDEIIVGRSLSMNSDEYYVLFYDLEDEEISGTYNSLVSGYKAKDDHMSIYTVDMSKSFNKPYTTDGEANKSPEKATDILVNGPTLIKVSDKKVVEYVEGEEAITDYLK